MKKPLRIGLLLVLAAGGLGYYVWTSRHSSQVLTGIVTTHDVIVSAQIPGQIGQLLVNEGDTVTAGQVLAVLVPDELRADTAYYASTAAGASSTVTGNEAALRFEEQQADSQILQAEASLAAAEAAQTSAGADLENAKLTFERTQKLVATGVASSEQFDQSRTAYAGQQARVASLGKQADVARAALAAAKSDAEQVAMRRGQLQASQHEVAAAQAQHQKAQVRLGYAELRAPLGGIVEVRAARQGEVVSPGQPIVTIVNPDDLWVRADVEETYVDRLRTGDHFTVRLPSGETRDGVVFYRGVDAGFATQRDVSRTKRDIKTFEVRLRVDNKDRRLAVGMTAYVLLPGA